jgi:hypothetical protein
MPKPFYMYNKQTQILSTIKELQEKINKLEQILSCQPFNNVNVFFYGQNGVFNVVTQHDFPFSLSGEIKLFMEDSILSMKNEINQLSHSL